MNVFNTAEVIDMGIEKEKMRRDFYGLVATRFSDRNMKDLFTRLKDWEETHIKKFTEIRQKSKTAETFESYPGELASYMRSIVDDSLYKNVSSDSFTKNVKTPIEAINYGMIFEKDAILFFSELLPYIELPDKERIAELIGEEKKHLVYLAELKKKY